jgi:integrase
LAKKIGINKRVGWRTFRRTFSSLLIQNGDVKVVQELARHSNPNTTLRLYAKANAEHLRSAQGRVMEMVRSAAMPVQPQTTLAQ